MKVKLLVSRAGADFSQSAGDEVEVSDGEAGRMIAAGQAVAVEVAVSRARSVQRAVPPDTTEKAVE